MITLAMCVSAQLSKAQAEWLLLGEKMVSRAGDEDIVTTDGEDLFSKIRICVQRRSVRFHDLDVVFGNGGSQDLQIRRVIQPGQCTRDIDIRGEARYIDQVILNYRTIGAYGSETSVGPQAIVEVYGFE